MDWGVQGALHTVGVWVEGTDAGLVVLATVKVGVRRAAADVVTAISVAVTD